jgi:tetratricopeptide (TPR) repeat protein
VRRHLGRARALEGLGRAEEAIRALVAARSLGQDGDAAVPDLARLLKASGRARAEEGELERAYARLKQAREVDPSDLELARDLSRVAERLGHLEEAVVLEELCADSVAAGDPAVAAAAYRRCAELLRDRLGDAERAAVLLEKAVSLAPEDGQARAELADILGRRRDGARRSLEGQLERSRLDLGDADALAAVAAVCRQLASSEADPRQASALVERARAAESIARFVSPGFPAPESPPLAPRVPPEVRSRLAMPGAEGAVGRLVALLAPYLEPLFPADLARRGVGAADRVGAASAPALLGRLESASRALEARPVALFLAPQGGCQVLLENTQPPALIVGAGALALPPGALSFLLARALHLCRAGWSLAGKFSPGDVAILCELACRFAGGEPPGLGLPEKQAGAFLEALSRSVPAPVRSWASALAAASTDELRGFDPRAFGAALQRTASRVALLYTGDAHGALTALAALDPEAAGDPVQALRLPDLRDVALFALSDLYLELRVLLLG